MRIGERRDPALVLVFILLTCGIYYLYFIYKVSEETQEYLGEPDTAPIVDMLLCFLTCGLWNIYWDYKTGKKIARMDERAGLPVTDNAVLYLILDLLGVGGFASVGIINAVLQQDSLNRIWDAAMTGGPSYPPSSPNIWPPPPSNPTPTPRQPRPPMP